MDATVRSYTYFLDTKYRTGGTNYQPEFTLVNVPVLASPDNYFEIQLISAEIPYSFSSISEPNNTVKLHDAVERRHVVRCSNCRARKLQHHNPTNCICKRYKSSNRRVCNNPNPKLYI